MRIFPVIVTVAGFFAYASSSQANMCGSFYNICSIECEQQVNESGDRDRYLACMKDCNLQKLQCDIKMQEVEMLEQMNRMMEW